MKDVQRLLANMPEEMEDNNDQVEQARAKVIGDFRLLIAERWKYIISLKDLVPGSHYETLINQMKESLQNLIEIHGTGVPFSPNPPDSLLEQSVVAEKGNIKSSASSDQGTSTTASSSKSESVAPKLLPHVFKFLQQPVTNEVWSCLQAC